MHHDWDGKTLQLIPKLIHDSYRHPGGEFFRKVGVYSSCATGTAAAALAADYGVCAKGWTYESTVISTASIITPYSMENAATQEFTMVEAFAADTIAAVGMEQVVEAVADPTPKRVKKALFGPVVSWLLDW